MLGVGALVGGALSAYGAYRSSKARQAGINRQIEAELAAREAAKEAARFRKVGFASPYGQMRTKVDAQGRLTNVGFDLDPRFQERADLYAGLGETMLGSIDVDPTAAAEARIARIADIRDPGRKAAQERMFSSLAAKGLTGLAVNQGYGGASNPYALAMMQAQEAQDAATAVESYDLARKNIAEDLALASTLFGEERGIYNIGRSEMDYGLGLADTERLRRMDAAGVDATIGRNIADYRGRAGYEGAERYEALLTSLGRLGGRAYDAGLFSGSSQYIYPQTTAYDNPSSAYYGEL